MWYQLHAPSMFNYAIMAHTPADSAEVVNGRVTEVPLEKLTGDFNQKNFMIKFRVNEVRGNNAFTSFDGHRLTSDYKRALTRRKNSRIDCNFVLKLQDDVQIRIKPIIMVDKRIKKSQERVLRATAHKCIDESLTKAHQESNQNLERFSIYLENLQTDNTKLVSFDIEKLKEGIYFIDILNLDGSSIGIKQLVKN